MGEYTHTKEDPARHEWRTYIVSQEDFTTIIMGMRRERERIIN